ncbi:hypothetical protein KC318_g11325 [Hortaea werneckii]|nr:hypothetical protein KC334_g11607 [Hortaea werneckii]KAI6961900.1 hypothetical protein KC355_g12545 [Hortaea werneckii]KAI7160536.1 hypothetical protein KC324_g13402 [Hortaea werneckii]KAI7557582.1 hypothetical protein KC316_g13448 [Hortaea werneckii]KAI7658269.1 hypothetical protein KC318_g11325 [Hortaea werneckii]
MHTVTGSAFISSQQNMALTGARLAKDAQLLLDAGFTSVREMAGYGIQLAAAIEEGSAVGPTIYSSNSIISPTGGHADLHTMPKSWFEDASDEMGVMVEEGHAGPNASSAPTATANPASWPRCTPASRRIEHGSYLDAEAAQLMKEKDAVLVATRLIVENGLALGEALPSPAGYAKLLAVAEKPMASDATSRSCTGVTLRPRGHRIPAALSPGANLIRQGLNGKEIILSCPSGA